ncbi:hypothetical protein V8E36_007080 [Tilletia maclaganii]
MPVRFTLRLAVRGGRSTGSNPPSARVFQRRFSSSSSARDTKEGTGQSGKVGKVPYDILFCGSDEFSCASLRAIHERKDLWKSLTVVHPPETKQGWGAKRMSVAPVQTVAASLGLVHVPAPSRGLDGWEPPASYPLDSPSALLLTVSFGHLIPTSLIARFPHPSHTLNLHPSLLPQLRGAAPLQWALARGLTKTGWTVQRLSRERFDHGQVLGQVEYDIPPALDFPALLDAVKTPAAGLLVDVLSNLPERDANSYEQTGTGSFAPKLKRDFSRVRWTSWTAQQVEARHRAMSYLYPLYTSLLPHSTSSAKPVFVHLLDVAVADSDTSSSIRERLGGLDVVPGSAVYIDQFGAIAVRCADSTVLLVHTLQVEGKKRRPAKDWIVGYRDRADDSGFLRFGEQSHSIP